jgi:hypothetical protein
MSVVSAGVNSFPLRSQEIVRIGGVPLELLSRTKIIVSVDGGPSQDVKSGTQLPVGKKIVTLRHDGAFVTVIGATPDAPPEKRQLPRPQPQDKLS